MVKYTSYVCVYGVYVPCFATLENAELIYAAMAGKPIVSLTDQW